MRKIIHIDMDAFFVSVEERDDPSLCGKPVVVGYDGPRGVVATANYVARRYGIHSAMSIARAHKLCHDLIVVPGHYDRYKEVSRQINCIFHDYTDIVEPLSLDEAYLDVTENKKGITLAVEIAREIKRRIHEQTALTASAGVSYCKFLAKIASDWHKPDGLYVVHPDHAQAFIDALSVEKIWGVGRKTAERMHDMGIFTGAQLRATALTQLTMAFGKMGKIFYDFAHGIDNRPVNTEWVRKSVGCERTYQTDIVGYDTLFDALRSLANELERRLVRHHFYGRSLILKVKYSNFRQTTHSHTTQTPFSNASDILHTAGKLLREVDTQQPVRLLGLTIAMPITSEETLKHGTQLTIDW